MSLARARSSAGLRFKSVTVAKVAITAMTMRSSTSVNEERDDLFCGFGWVFLRFRQVEWLSKRGLVARELDLFVLFVFSMLVCLCF